MASPCRSVRQGTEILTEHLELATRCGGRWGAGWFPHLLGEVALSANPDEVEPYFERAIEICREIEAENELAKAYSGIGRLYKLRGEYAEARRYLTDALEILERLGTVIEPDRVKKELREMPG